MMAASAAEKRGVFESGRRGSDVIIIATIDAVMRASRMTGYGARFKSNSAVWY
jgi:hypothetical protein